MGDRMIRKQVYIEPKHQKLLKKAAKHLGISEAELIRRGIELVTATRDAASSPPAPQPFAEQAWREVQAVIAERKKMKAPQTGRTWTRDEIYEERIAKLAH